ncbi:hypothetical protein HPULCUR_002973 [Helicostylum pulchrum]|uniref:3'-5' exonuclease domain-containing protein n=1 Tax=Helicostylum pulchrum TaxID=562976 RepID=A0ABP9XTD6_9FUNG
MESEFTLTTEELWKNTIRTVESAYCWLLTYEGKDYELVNNSIASLKKLISHGKSYEAMKTYRSLDLPGSIAVAAAAATITTTSSAILTTIPKTHRKKFNYTPITQDLEPNWTRLDDRTIQVELEPSGQTATCISVTTASQLDQVIDEVYQSKCIAVDCEFLGVRKSLPELKLLQIGVSKYKGYAIQVDIIGVKVVTDKLKRILEDESLDIIGWAFRSDALAIESYIQGIELAPVLDLQAKLKPIAVEQMNLGNALNKFASEWSGNREFQKAKLTGTQFLFTGDDCIWLVCPLPPTALVYAVFDVLSVLALHEYTQQYPSLEEYYWPYTVTSQSSQKAVDRWHVQRATGINTAPNSGTINIVKPKNSAKLPVYRKPSSNTTRDTDATNIVRITEDGYDDEDARYQRDLKLALELSVKDAIAISNAAESSGTDRVIEPTNSTYKSTILQSVEQELNSTTLDQKDLAPRFSDAPVQETNDADIEYDTWGTKMLDDQPFIGNNFADKVNEKQPAQVSEKQPARAKTYQWSNDTSTKHQWETDTSKELPSKWGDASLDNKGNIKWVDNNTTTTNSPQSGIKAQWNNERTQSSTNPWSTYKETDGSQWNSKWDVSSKGSPSQWKESKVLGTTSPKNTYSSTKPTENKLSPMLSPKPSTSSNYKNGNNNSLRPSPSQTSSKLEPKDKSPQFISCKPDKKKYTSDLKSRIQVGNQGGSFTWAPETKDQMSSKSWKSFVNSTIDDWKNGKDLTMDALMNPTISKDQQRQEEASSSSVKFNIKVQDNYTRGGKIGDSETGTMNTESLNNWETKEERPDTMQMPMNQIPIRTQFTGPRLENPLADDHESDDDDDDYDDDDHSQEFPIIKGNIPLTRQTQVKSKSQIIESFSTFVDGKYLYGKDTEPELLMLRLTTPEELDMVYMPPEGTDFTVAIGYHFVRGTRGFVLKAIQAYLSTGESYTALVEKTFMMRPLRSLKNTKFGRLLTDPSIKRVCWSPSYIEEEMLKKLGFTFGPCIDLAFRANHGREETLSFMQSVDHYSHDWLDRKQFIEAKKEFEAMNAKKFSSTCWDREKLPELVTTYCALQGLAIYCLYQKTLKVIDEDDRSFMYSIE